MIEITNNESYKLSLEIISHNLKAKVLRIFYKEIITLNGNNSERNEVLITYWPSNYINKENLEEILKEYYG